MICFIFLFIESACFCILNCLIFLGKVEIESHRPLNDGMWHDIKVIQNGGVFTLMVDHRNKSR